MTTSAVLALATGDVFEGTAVGACGRAIGEVVFNTAMTGYQEILTDPSYARQIVTLTHPHIGNTGANSEDDESSNAWVAGLVIRDLPPVASNWRSEMTLEEYLVSREVVAIAGVDTRRLTGILRDKGSQSGCILCKDEMTEADVKEAIDAARGFEGLEGMDLASVVSTRETYEWREGTWRRGEGFPVLADERYHVVAYDFGTKRNILRMLVDRGCRVTVVPARTPPDEVLAMEPDGIFLTNGPGDPDPCDYAIDAVRQFLQTDIPMFGICLGHQLLGLAAGMKTVKMNHGHHGANHPVKNLEDGTVLITSQNHGFCVDDVALPNSVTVTHRSLFDGSLQGIRMVDRPAFGFQGHPEASPGPHDAGNLFDRFIEMLEQRKRSD